VSAYDVDEAGSDDVDYRLAVDGFVTLFHSPTILAETTAWLARHGYRVVTADASQWRSEADLHDGLARALEFPDYYGANLDALNDCLRDVASGRSGLDQGATGIVLVLPAYDSLAASHPSLAHAVLDIFAVRARGAALIGRRMLCLVQSRDPALRFEPVGATPVLWNDAEWLDATRRA
jgi:hypothetical protein